MDDLQGLLNIVREDGKNTGLNINTEKTKLLIISCKIEDFQNVELTHNNQSIERVTNV